MPQSEEQVSSQGPLCLAYFVIPDEKPQVAALQNLQNAPQGSERSAVLQQTLKQLKQDLAVTWTSNDRRVLQLQTEIGKADSYIKSKLKEMKSMPSQGSVDSVSDKTSQNTIKLKLHQPSATESSQRKLSDNKNKRKRSRIAETDDDDDASAYSASRRQDSNKKLRRQSAAREGSVITESAEVESSQAELVDKADKKGKSSQSVQITTFWNYVEQYFKPVTDDDIKQLNTVDRTDPAPFIVPTLGKNYHEIWAEEDKALLPGAHSDNFRTKDSEVYCGTLTERILSALLEDELIGAPPSLANSESGESVHSVTTPLRSITRDEVYDVEERIRRELRFLGLVDSSSRAEDQDDDISLELRRLQQELRKVSRINEYRIAVVQQAAFHRIAYQEYQGVLEELNTQIEASYQRRFKAGIVKNRAKRSTSAFPNVGQRTPQDALQSLLLKRRQLIDEIAPLFPLSITEVPLHSIFVDELEEEMQELSQIVIVPNTDSLSRFNKLRQQQSPVSSRASSQDLSQIPVGIINVAASSQTLAVSNTSSNKPKKARQRKSQSAMADDKQLKAPKVAKQKKPKTSVTQQDVSRSNNELSLPPQTINPAALMNDDYSFLEKGGIPDWMFQSQ